MPFGNLNYESWHCEAGAAVIILIFGNSRRFGRWGWIGGIFSQRDVSAETQFGKSRMPVGFRWAPGKQLCHSIAAQSDQTEKRLMDRRHTEPNSRAQQRSEQTEAHCPNPHCCWQHSCGYSKERITSNRNRAQLTNNDTEYFIHDRCCSMALHAFTQI